MTSASLPDKSDRGWCATPWRLVLCWTLQGITASLCALHPLEAQTPEGVTHAAEAIAAATLAHSIAELASDSLGNRQTPSVALDRTAGYLAARFQALGLRPGAGNKDWVQRYPVPGRVVRLDSTTSHLLFTYSPRPGGRNAIGESNQLVEKRFKVPLSSARFVLPRVPEVMAENDIITPPPMVLLTGHLTSAFLRQAHLARTSVLYLPPAGPSPSPALLEELARVSWGAVVLPADSATAGEMYATGKPLHLDDMYLFQNPLDAFELTHAPWAMVVQPEKIAALLPGLGVDLAEARAADTPTVRPLPGLQVTFTPLLDPKDTTRSTRLTAPNLIGVLEGSDSTLRRECLVLTAPLDQREASPSDPAHATPIAGTSTSSLAGLLELARAFGSLTIKPRRSIVFLATSGGVPDQGFWGSYYYTFTSLRGGGVPCSPIFNLVIDLSVGRPAIEDTAVIAGIDEVTLDVPPAWVARTHSELGLTVRDGGTVTSSRTEPFTFGRAGIPGFLVQRGPLGGDGAVPHNPLDPEWTARLLRLVCYLSYGIADAAQPPKWSEIGRQRLFEQR